MHGKGWDSRGENPRTNLSEKERIVTFEEVISKIPPTWICLDCGLVFDNSPDGESAYARRTAIDANGRQYVEGEVCQKCFYKK